MVETIESAVVGGLADPVFGSQAIFRPVMDAFAAPGRIVDLGGLVSAPAALEPAAAAFLASLADNDTPVWIADPNGADRQAAAWIAFQTDAPITRDPSDAAFAVLPGHAPAAGWSVFPSGTPDYPDRSATLILPVSDFETGSRLVLTGPGIETSTAIAPAGLPGDFVTVRGAEREGFPLGHDLLLVCGTRALALPRSTRIREG